MVDGSAVVTVTVTGSQMFNLNEGGGSSKTAAVVDSCELSAGTIFVLQPEDDITFRHSTANCDGSSERP